jgi:hypothetical protein
VKHGIRFWIGLLVVAPIAVFTHVLALVIGKERAVGKLGGVVTMCAKSLQQFFPPTITNASEFDRFKEQVKPQYLLYKIWSILYDYHVEYPDDDSVLLVIKNCPFANALKIVKLPEFGVYMCQGDWEVAKDNSQKWKFERTGTIGTGCEICDFKYIRIH